MKKLLFILTLAAAYHAPAQDIFQQKFYAPELILKYREEAGLSPDQVEKIKSTYNADLPAYNNKKWDLDAAMSKLEQLIAQSSVDSKAANAQLEKTLALEAEIKKMKLATLIKIKNILTPAQQAKLDVHKSETIASESSIITSLNEDQRVTVKIRDGKTTPGKPLYVIIDSAGKETMTDANPDISPDDIESISVFKDKAATAIYGARGENGVIVIKCKKK